MVLVHGEGKRTLWGGAEEKELLLNLLLGSFDQDHCQDRRSRHRHRRHHRLCRLRHIHLGDISCHRSRDLGRR